MVSEPVSVVSEPVSLVSLPVSVVSQPVRMVSERVRVGRVCEPTRVVSEPVCMVSEPIRAISVAVRVVSEPVRVAVRFETVMLHAGSQVWSSDRCGICVCICHLHEQCPPECLSCYQVQTVHLPRDKACTAHQALNAMCPFCASGGFGQVA